MIPVPEGFMFAAVSAGFKQENKLDLGLVWSRQPATAAAVFTKNRFQAAPVLVTQEALETAPEARGVLINAGQANACTGEAGLQDCRLSIAGVAKALDARPQEILPGSTGVIGIPLDMAKWEKATPALAASLGQAGPMEFARAIMTTDAYPKLAWAEVPGEEEGASVKILGIAKGAGMICPDMATMLVVLLCDAEVSPDLWKEILLHSVNGSFNTITVDGDTSTNDTVFALANGASGVTVGPRSEGLKEALTEAVASVCWDLARLIVEDGEGGTKVIRIHVEGAVDDTQAQLAARTIGHSPLVKTAMFGRDPNWGRVAAALGRSGAEFNPDKVTIRLDGLPLFANGAVTSVDYKNLLKAAMRHQDIAVDVDLGMGTGSYVLLASDLSHEYITINAEYST